MLGGKQKSFLRALANKERPVVQIGKDNITENLIISISDYLEAHELMKVSLLKSCSLETREAAIEIAANTGSEIVQLIGRTIVLYRKSKENRILLPR